MSIRSLRFQRKHGRVVVDHMNHQEVVMLGIRYFWGFLSGVPGGWLCYKAKIETQERPI